MPLVGGPSEVKNVDDEVKEICEKVKDELSSRIGKAFDDFVPLVYRSQLVNGINYFVKVRTGADEHVHVRVHKSFQGDVTLHSFQQDKGLDDELEYFQ